MFSDFYVLFLGLDCFMDGLCSLWYLLVAIVMYMLVTSLLGKVLLVLTDFSNLCFCLTCSSLFMPLFISDFSGLTCVHSVGALRICDINFLFCFLLDLGFVYSRELVRSRGLFVYLWFGLFVGTPLGLLL